MGLSINERQLDDKQGKPVVMNVKHILNDGDQNQQEQPGEGL